MTTTNSLDQVIRTLGEVQASGGVGWDTSRIVALIVSARPDSSGLRELIERFGGSPLPAIVSALAVCTLDDATVAEFTARGGGAAGGYQSQATLEHVLRLAELMPIENANSLALCLTAMTLRSEAVDLHLDSSALRRLGTFLISCSRFDGEQAFLVRIGLVDLLDKLELWGTALSAFPGDAGAILRLWLAAFADLEGEGPFAEQAREILNRESAAGRSSD